MVVAAVAGWALKAVATKAAMWAAKKTVVAGVDAYKDFKKSAEEKLADRIDPTQPCAQTKDERRRARANAIEAAETRLSDPNLPDDQKKELEAATTRFKRNNDAVEYAKLSEHSYDQYDPNLKGRAPSGPPEGWEVADPAALGLNPKDLVPPPPSTFRAVVYRNQFGMTPEYTVAFRGTEPKAGQNDINVDIENAAGAETSSYAAAKKLVSKIGEGPMAGKFAVTGHSLGGGLAQTAAMKADPIPPGFMFNSAGAHPAVAEVPAIDGSTFQQFRSPCDPLTFASGVQKPEHKKTDKPAGAGSKPTDGDFSVWESIKKVTAVAGNALDNRRDYGWTIPPNAGAMHEVASVDAKGKDVPCWEPGAQHSVSNLVNGIEKEKTVDLLVMQKFGAASVQAKARAG